MSNRSLHRATPVWAAALACAGPLPAAWAQADAGTASSQTIVITGNPLARERGAAPVSVLSGEGLSQRRAASLGETLDGLPGVASSGFGPNAGRPVIRGLDGDRIRVLDNGGASSDASNLSFDHAVASDPLVAERIEVLRGPAALLYGGNATGGVVNTIDNRIPRKPAAGLSGRAEARFGGATNQRSAAVVLDGGVGARGSGLAWHIDAYGRRSDDQRAPRYTPLEDGEVLEPTRRVRNSAADAQGGAVGVGWVGAGGFGGLAVDTHRHDYGVTVEPEVTIRMKRDRLAAAGEWRDLAGRGSALALQASRTDYRHQEFEGAEVGTTFDSAGSELRAEFRHAAWRGLQGVIGVQAEKLDFSALGDEAFVPDTRTRSSAVFVLEELKLAPFTLIAGARAERVRVRSAGDPAGSDEPRFGDAAERQFTPASVSLQLAAEAGPGWQALFGIGRTERAPAYYELYANGEHVATGAFERGDPGLPLERSRHVEAGLSWNDGTSSFSFNGYRTDFGRYIALDATGEEIDDLPEYAFRAVRARLTGFEAEWRTRVALAAASRPLGIAAIEFSVGVDRVRGENRDSGEALARLPPLRLHGTLAARWAETVLTLSLHSAGAQRRVPASDTETASWTRIDLAASGRLLGVPGARWFVSARNLRDTLAYNATAVQTIRGLAPREGRSVGGGVQWRF